MTMPRFAQSRGFVVTMAGISALGVCAVIGCVYYLEKVGNEGESTALAAFLLNTVWLIVFVVAGCWLFGLRWRVIATSPLWAVAEFGLATAPLAYALNEWTFAPGFSGMIFHWTSNVVEAVGLGTAINMFCFLAVALVLHAFSKRGRTLANLGVLVSIFLALALPLGIPVVEFLRSI